jgi:hypothetical protein
MLELKALALSSDGTAKGRTKVAVGMTWLPQPKLSFRLLIFIKSKMGTLGKMSRSQLFEVKYSQNIEDWKG